MDIVVGDMYCFIIIFCEQMTHKIKQYLPSVSEMSLVQLLRQNTLSLGFFEVSSDLIGALSWINF